MSQITNANYLRYFNITNSDSSHAWKWNESIYEAEGLYGINSTSCTATWTALRDIKNFSFDYSYSTESSKFDPVTITVGSTTVTKNVGGKGYGSYGPIDIIKGTTITFCYEKDNSNSGKDGTEYVEIKNIQGAILGCYFGENTKAKTIKKIYVGIEGKARKIKRGYIGIANKARLFFYDNIEIEVFQDINYTMMYDSGDECIDLTGGYSSYTHPNYTGHGTFFSKETDSIYYGANTTDGNVHVNVYTENSIDLKDYVGFCVIQKTSSTRRICCWSYYY